MMCSSSWVSREAPWIWHSAHHQEPPTWSPSPDLDELVINHGQSPIVKPIGEKTCKHHPCIFPNIGGWPQMPDGNLKLEQLCGLVNQVEIECLDCAEVNTYWDLLPYSQWLPQHTQGWWENQQCSVSCNKRDPHAEVYQPGGTMLLVVNQLLDHALCPGDDPKGIGWWCSTQLSGAQQKVTRLVALYWMHKSGPLMVYQQQAQALEVLNCYDNPQKALLQDLAREMTSWMEAGDQVIVMGDFNLSIQSDVLIIFWPLWYGGSSFYPIQQSMSNLKLGSLTYWWHIPIPDLFHLCKGGFLTFGNCITSKHHGIWLDLSLSLVFPSLANTIFWPLAQHLQYKDLQNITHIMHFSWTSYPSSSLSTCGSSCGTVQRPLASTPMKRIWAPRSVGDSRETPCWVKLSEDQSWQGSLVPLNHQGNQLDTVLERAYQVQKGMPHPPFHHLLLCKTFSAYCVQGGIDDGRPGPGPAPATEVSLQTMHPVEKRHSPLWYMDWQLGDAQANATSWSKNPFGNNLDDWETVGNGVSSQDCPGEGST